MDQLKLVSIVNEKAWLELEWRNFGLLWRFHDVSTSSSKYEANLDAALVRSLLKFFKKHADYPARGEAEKHQLDSMPYSLTFTVHNDDIDFMGLNGVFSLGDALFCAIRYDDTLLTQVVVSPEEINHLQQFLNRGRVSESLMSRPSFGL